MSRLACDPLNLQLITNDKVRIYLHHAADDSPAFSAWLLPA
jgi:hypothetical protein